MRNYRHVHEFYITHKLWGFFVVVLSGDLFCLGFYFVYVCIFFFSFTDSLLNLNYLVLESCC